MSTQSPATDNSVSNVKIFISILVPASIRKKENAISLCQISRYNLVTTKRRWGGIIVADADGGLTSNRLAKIKEAKEALEKREQALNPGKKIDDKKQISFADKEARIMGKKGNFDYSYNGQISVDEDNQIIVGQHLSQNANDKQEVEPALEEIKETTGDLPDEMSLDNGYMSGNNLESFDGKEIDVYVATGKGEKKDQRPIEDSNRKIKKVDFNYDESKDCFVCPAGHTLKLRTETNEGKKVYQGDKSACDLCHYKARCCSSKKGEPRTIPLCQ